MKILGFDLETGAKFGTDTHENFITEIGAALFDTHYNQPVKIYSKLVNEAGFDVIDPEAEVYTGISQSMRDKYGAPGEIVCAEFRELALEADYYMAHNGINFDIPILQAVFTRYKCEWVDKVCIDSQHHVKYPKAFKKSLGALANAHLTMNPFPHRAISDVLTMFNIIFPPHRETYNLEQIIQYAKEPKYLVRACVGYPKREEAKSRGFHWSSKEVSEGYPKGSWVTTMTETEIKDCSNIYPFRLEPLRKI